MQRLPKKNLLISLLKLGILTWESEGLTYLWGQPQVAIREPAVCAFKTQKLPIDFFFFFAELNAVQFIPKMNLCRICHHATPSSLALLICEYNFKKLLINSIVPFQKNKGERKVKFKPAIIMLKPFMKADTADNPESRSGRV